MLKQLTLFTPFEKPRYLAWWNMHDFIPVKGSPMQLFNLFEKEDGSTRCEFFREGFILEVYPEDKKCLCWFPQPIGYSYIEELIGLVDYDGMNPITEYGFDLNKFKLDYPLKNEYYWRSKIIVIQ